MSTLIHIDKEYALWVKELSIRYRKAQIKAAVKANTEMIAFYWSLGQDIVNRDAERKYGRGFFNNLSADLKDKLPGVTGLSPRNLRYTERFYTLYEPLIKNLQQYAANSEENLTDGILQHAVAKSSDDVGIVNLQRLVANLNMVPWGHHTVIIDKSKGDVIKAYYYVCKVLQNNWSRDVLANYIDSALYEREGKAITNFKNNLPAPNSDLAQQITKDPYIFDFAALTDRYNEKELKDALIDNIEKFLLELGQGFAYMGREYRLPVGKTEQYLDMLFYNVNIHAYVVLECKVTSFEPSYIGQLGAYVVAVDHQLRKEGDNKTIGILVCKDKDEVMARYALESTSQPLGVSSYKLSKLIPEKFKGLLPSIEEIEANLKDED